MKSLYSDLIVNSPFRFGLIYHFTHSEIRSGTQNKKYRENFINRSHVIFPYFYGSRGLFSAKSSPLHTYVVLHRSPGRCSLVRGLEVYHLLASSESGEVLSRTEVYTCSKNLPLKPLSGTHDPLLWTPKRTQKSSSDCPT